MILDCIHMIFCCERITAVWQRCVSRPPLSVVPPILHVYKKNQFRLPSRPQQLQLHHHPQHYLYLHSSSKFILILHSARVHIQAPTWYSQEGLKLPKPSCLMVPQMLFCFFCFENVPARTKQDKEKAQEHLCYLNGSPENFFFEIFASDGTLSEDGKDYQKVSHFKLIEAPQDIILRATSATLDQDDLLASLRELDSLYARAGFNDAVKFGVLRNAVLRLPELAQFAAYRGALNYDTLHTAVKY